MSIWDQCKKHELRWPSGIRECWQKRATVMNIDDRPTDLRANSHTAKFQMAITLQRAIRFPSCLVLWWGFRGRRIERRRFRLDQIQDGSCGSFWKFQIVISLQRVIWYAWFDIWGWGCIMARPHWRQNVASVDETLGRCQTSNKVEQLCRSTLSRNYVFA